MARELKKKVFFRADGNSTMGLGHVIRSLALAEMIKEDFYLTFIIRTPGEYFINEIRSVCDDLIDIPAGLSGESESEFVSGLLQPDDLIVLDGYAFDESYQRILKRNGIHIICIDDIYSTHFTADAIINHTSGIPITRYQAEFYTRFYLGADYALLRMPFLQCAREPRKIEKAENIFISFGGADPYNYTCTVANELLFADRFSTINVVIGAAFSHKNELQEILRKDNKGRLRIHQSLDVDQMLDLMLQSQVGICAASSVAFEYCCAGGGLFVIKTADNQEDCYRFLVDDRLAREYSSQAVQSVTIHDIEEMIATQKRNFNGQSIKHLRSIFNFFLVQDKIHFRRAHEEDSKILFEWANDPDVRKNSIHKNRIEWDTHVSWFTNKLANPNAILFIFSLGSEHIGQVRMDLIDKSWLISFSVAREARGKGYAEIIVYKSILALKQELNASFTLKAQVQEDNIPSLKVFQHLGFMEGEPEVLEGHLFRSFYKTSL